VYHSGTIGACLSGRNGGISGVAVSQSVTGFGIEGQGWDEMLVGQKWETAATVASAMVGGLVADMPSSPVVVNLNVPNLPLEEITEWRHTRVGTEPPRRMSSAVLEPKEGHDSTYYVRMSWGDAVDLPLDTDGGTVEADIISISYLSRLAEEHRDDMGTAESALDRLITR
jgi:5'-nucleotidase